MRKGKLDEANIQAEKINDLIVNNRSKTFSNLSNSSTKELWQSIKLNSVNSHSVSYPCLQDVNAVNHYFASVSYDNNLKLNYDSVYLTSNSNVNIQLDDSFNCDINVLIDEYLLRNLKRTSPGIDNIPSWVFKQCSYELSSVVCHIFNYSLLSGELPDQWRKAIVTPIPKVPNPQTITEFRPISVAPIL